MNSRFAVAAYKARLSSGITQARASDLMGLSIRSIQKYEAGHQIPTDPVVARMVLAYNSPALGYCYLSGELETGRLLLPQLPSAGAASRSLRLKVALEHVKALQAELDQICLDDVVDAAEQRLLAGQLGKYQELAAACMGVQIMAGFTQNKKDALAGGPRHL